MSAENQKPHRLSPCRSLALVFFLAGLSLAGAILYFKPPDPLAQFHAPLILEVLFALLCGTFLMVVVFSPQRWSWSLQGTGWILGILGVGFLFLYSVADAADNFVSTHPGGAIALGEETAKLLGMGALIGAIVQWIRELRSREQELKESEQRFRDVAEAAGEYIWEIDSQGIYTMITAPAEELLGRGMDEMLGRSPLEFMPPQEAERVQKLLEECARTHSSWQGLEHQSLRPDGTIVWQRVSGLPLFDSAGNLSGFRGTGMDITGEKEARQAEQVMSERLRLATEAAQLGIWDMRLSDNWLDWDQGMFRIYGLEPGEFNHDVEDWYQAVLPEHLERAAQEFQEGVQSGTSYRSTFSIRRKDGEIRHIRAMAQPIHDENGHPIRVVGINEDVTFEVESRRQLEETTRELEGFFEVSLGLLLIATLEGHFLKLNQAWETILGYQPEDLIHQQFLDFIHPEDRDKTLEAMSRLSQGEKVTDFVNRYQHKDGSYRWIRWQASAHGRFIYASANDITESVVLQERLAQEKDFLQLIIDSTPNPVFAKDWQGRHTLVNQAVADLFGTTKEELLGQTDHETTATAEEVQAFLRDDREVMQSGQSKHIPEEKLTDSQGQVRWFQTTKVPLILSEKPEERQVLGVANDITELKTQKEKMELILEAAQNVSFVITSPTPNHEDALIQEFSPGAENLFGYNKEEVLGEQASILHSLEDMEKFPEIHERISAGQAWHGRANLVRKSGESFPALFTVYPFKVYGNNATLGVSIDITELERAQEEMRRAKEEAEAANRSKSEFLANMSHEIRTPMNAVIGLSDLLLQTHLNPEQKDYLNKINSSSRMLLGIINDILDYSKIQAGKLELDSHRFRLDELLDQMKTLFGNAAGEKGLELLFRVSPEVPQALIGDSLRLGQVFSNLLGNAIKFTEQGHVEMNITRIGGDQEHTRLLFEVRDTGIGMDKNQMERLFQAFSQADSSTTRKYGGTGLGLVISRKLVEHMGGTLQVNSNPGEGSNFFFELSLPVAQKSMSQGECPELQGSRVLVVDDHAPARMVLRELLEGCRYQVTEAESGEAAIQSVLEADQAGKPFDFILVDWKMPGELDGLQTIQRLQRMSREGELTLTQAPMFIVSAYNREDIPDDHSEYDAFLGKPVTASSLFDAMIDAVGAAPRKSPDPDPARIPSFVEASILLAEDNALNQEVAQQMLEKTGARVTLAHNGLQAVEKVQAESFDLVLMDLQMPVMDGFQAAREIRAIHPELPVIAVSAAVMEADRENSRNAGMQAHLAKPIDSSELYQTLVQWLPESGKEMQPGSRATSEAGPLPDHLEGFDLEQGLRLADKDRGFYLKMLHQFRDQLAGQFSDLPRQLEQREKDTWQMVHTLKGLSGTVGAERLKNIATQIDLAFKEQTRITPKMHQELGDALDTALSALKNIPSLPDNTREVDYQQGAQAMEELKSTLLRNELVEEELLETVEGFLQTHLGNSHAAELKALVQNFELDQAASLLAKYAQEIGVEVK